MYMEDISKAQEEKILKNIGRGLQSQIILYGFLTFAFFLAVYNYPEVYFISMLGILILALFMFFKDQQKPINYLIVIASLYLLFLPTNIFYQILIVGIFHNPIGLQVRFDLEAFFSYYGLLSLFAIIADTIIAVILYRQMKGKKIKLEEAKPYEYGVWDYFLIDTDWKKVLELFALLTVSAIAEEIIFRFFLINIFTSFQMHFILAIFISSIIFGLMHYINGGWIFIINSTFAGIFFGFAFYYFGIVFSLTLHFFWNILVIFQMFINTKLIPNRIYKNDFPK